MERINLLYLLLLVFGEIQNSLSCQTKPTGLDFQGGFSFPSDTTFCMYIYCVYICCVSDVHFGLCQVTSLRLDHIECFFFIILDFMVADVEKIFR